MQLKNVEAFEALEQLKNVEALECKPLVRSSRKQRFLETLAFSRYDLKQAFPFPFKADDLAYSPWVQKSISKLSKRFDPRSSFEHGS